MADKFDIAVIGSGSAGFSAAEQANSLGAKVCIVEEDAWGGECPNYACIPTKALLRSAKLYHHTKHHASDYGVHTGRVTFNFAEIMQRKRAVVDLITGKGERLKKTAHDLGMTAVSGSARFMDEHTIQVGARKIKADKFVIATGATSFIPPVAGLAEADYMTYQDAVSLSERPGSILVIGGGPVGCEFSTFFGMLGTKVTLLQIAPYVLHREDPEISEIARNGLEHIGVDVRVNTKAVSVKKSGRKWRVTFRTGRSKVQSVTVERILVAAGVRANVGSLALEKAGVKLDEKGRLKVSETLQTNKKHIFAAGDVSGGLMFTHTAHEEGYIAGTNAMQKTARTMLKRDQRVVPRATFVEPEVASVGTTEQEAKDAGKDVLIGRFPVGALGRAVTDGKRQGVVKLIVDKKSRRILGGHIAAERAGEMIHEVTLAMQKRLKVDEIAHMMHAFPTYSEAVLAAASMVP